jgi:hypothetical protein
MTILLIAFAWTAVLSVIVGLCAAARQGDLAQPGQRQSAERSPSDRLGWNPTSARAPLTRTRTSTDVPTGSTGLAA